MQEDAPIFFRGGSGAGYLRLLALLASMVSNSPSLALPLLPGKMLRQLMAEPSCLGCSGVGGGVGSCPLCPGSPSMEPRGVCVGFSPFPLSPCSKC